MSETPPVHYLQVFIDATPQAHALGFQLVSADERVAVIAAPYRPELIGDVETGVIAGGVVTTLLDQTCAAACYLALGGYRPVVTLDLRIDYMRAARPGQTVIAEAEVMRLTKSIAFVRARAYDDDRSDPAAAAQAAFMIDLGGETARPAPKETEA